MGTAATMHRWRSLKEMREEGGCRKHSHQRSRGGARETKETDSTLQLREKQQIWVLIQKLSWLLWALEKCLDYLEL